MGTDAGQGLTREQVMALADRERVRFVNLQFTDIVGMVKSVTIPLHQLDACFSHGKWFDGSSIEGFARIAESDMFLVPDPATFAVLPWERDPNAVTAKVVCDVFNPDGSPFEGDPRYILRRAVEHAQRLGFDFKTGPELEFFLFHADAVEQGRYLTYDQASYFDLSTDTASNLRKDMVNALEELGILVETSHHEVAPGQHEIDFEYGDAIRTADNALAFKYCLKAIASQHGVYATFMPKPLAGISGSGMHTHQSLFDRASGANAFFDPNDDYNLSNLARQFVAGQLAHARGMCAVLAPTVNSYKRLVPGFEAPVYISWARTNRSALVRIPKIHSANGEAARVELRCPDPACNPYLAFAVMLRCGLDGIERSLTPPAPVEEDVYHFTPEQLRARSLGTLPGSLGEALDDLRRDELVRETLGSHVIDRFVEAKSSEWDSFRLQVTPWELSRYLSQY